MAGPQAAARFQYAAAMHAEKPASWYALVVQTNHEKTVFQRLATAGFEAFLPVCPTRRQWSDRVKNLDVPIFPGYIFCRFSLDQRLAVLRVPGVHFIVPAGRRPEPLPDEEIAGLRAIIAAEVRVYPHLYLKVGQRVLVISGPLRGIEGALLQVKRKWQVVVNIELLQRSVAAEVHCCDVSPMKQCR